MMRPFPTNGPPGPGGSLPERSLAADSPPDKSTHSLRDLTRDIIAAAIEVHRNLGGPGLLCKVYQEALVCALLARDLPVARDRWYPVVFEGRMLEQGLHVDLVVAQRILVACHTSPFDRRVAAARLMTALRTTRAELGLVLHFDALTMRRGIFRVRSNEKPDHV